MTAFTFFMILLLPVCLGIGSIASPVLDRTTHSTIYGVDDVSARSANTCADPSLARTIFEGFSGLRVAHILRFHGLVVDLATHQSVSGTDAWTFQGPVFQAWRTQQPFTVPLYQLFNPDLTDFIFMAGVDTTTLPVVSGFSTNTANIFAWVYSTAICGSVPLMSASLAAQSDHYYTTDPDEHADLLAGGWSDSGVVAFVLPLPSL